MRLSRYTSAVLAEMRRLEAQGIKCKDAYAMMEISKTSTYNSFRATASHNRIWSNGNSREGRPQKRQSEMPSPLPPRPFEYSGKPSMSNRITGAELLYMFDISVRFTLQQEAKRRGCTVRDLIKSVIERTTRDNLFKAILED